MMNELGHCRNPDLAFNLAITEGRLTTNQNDNNFAGHYMYMYTENNRDMFKNIITRKYDV